MDGEFLVRSGAKMAGTSDPGEYPLHLRLLGGFEVALGPHRIDTRVWRQRKVATLIKRLALAEGHRLHRDQLLDLLWPQLDPAAAANNLHYSLHVARRILNPAKASRARPLQWQGDMIVLYPPESLWIDVEAFSAAAAVARGGDDPAAYQAALALYTGDLLPEDRYEEWVEERRRMLRALHLSLLFDFAGVMERRGEWSAAIEPLHRVLVEDPALEEVHVALMRLYARIGQRQAALHQYEQLRRFLGSVGAEPQAASRELEAAIRNGRLTDSEQVDIVPAAVPAEQGRHNLPAMLTSLVGRQFEIASIRRTLRTARLVTLQGAGGVGKTRLAQAVGWELVETMPDGVWLVQLAPLSRGELVPHAVARVLGIGEEAERPLISTLVDALQGKRLLLLLDNCEHLAGAVAEVTERLVHFCPQVHILATSREALGVDGEVRYTVSPLPVSLEKAAPSEGIQLFVERARSRQAGFALTAANGPAVLQICRQVEGLPLGIELAAARLGALSIEQISARLPDTLGLLVGGSRIAPPRHQSLRAALDWSYELLGAEEQALFRRLSVFAGGWTLEAAEAVGLPENGVGGVVDVLAALVDKSLVVADAAAEGSMRYRFLTPVRQYAQQRLEGSAEAAAAHRHHAAFFLTWAERAQTELYGPDQAVWLHRLESEHDNLRAALEWSGNPEGDAELGLRLGAKLWLFWYTRGYLREGQHWLEIMLSAAPDRATPYRAEAYRGISAMAYGRRQYKNAAIYANLALDLYRQLDDRPGVARCLNTLAAVYLDQGEWEEARRVGEEALALRREQGDQLAVAQSLVNLGNLVHCYS